MTYDEFIQNILDTRGRFGIPDGEYKERHHIVPKCLGGTNNRDNLVDLYAREHYEAHRLLAEENPDNRGLQVAWFNMSMVSNERHQRCIIGAEEFERARMACSKAMSGEGNPMFGVHLTGEKASRYGKLFSEESKKKISEHHADVSGSNNPMYGKSHTEETREKISKKNKGKKRTKEQRLSMSLAKKGKGTGSSNSMARKLYQYDLDWNLIKVYGCIKDAASENGYGYSTLQTAITKRRPSHGFYWTRESNDT